VLGLVAARRAIEESKQHIRTFSFRFVDPGERNFNLAAASSNVLLFYCATALPASRDAIDLFPVPRRAAARLGEGRISI
jgi:hypothetical protein